MSALLVANALRIKRRNNTPAGETHMRHETSRRRFLQSSTAALGALAYGTNRRAEAQTNRPNVLLIMVDQWRADALGCAGHPTAQTPHLDVIAGGGTRFTQAYAAVPSCIAARAGFLTGQSQASHGFVGYRDGVVWRYEHTLPGTLSAGGYQTHCVGKMHVHPIRNRVGFDSVDLHNGSLHYARTGGIDPGRIDDYVPWLREQVGAGYVDYTDTGLGCNGYVATPWTLPERLHPTAWVTERSLDFLRRRDPTQPFFLMASYHRPHPPLDPPIAYLDRYRDLPLPPIVEGDWVEHQLVPNSGLDSPVPHDAAQIDYARRAYFAQLTFIDHQINRLSMALQEEGVAGNTWIIFCSDHGEMLFDHKLIAKAQAFGASAGIPLIVRPPGGRFRGQAVPRTNDRPVELRDIYPTLCQLAGLPIPPTVEGHSLLPLLEGSTAWPRPWLHGEHPAGDRSNHWLTDGVHRYVWYPTSGRELLFDLTIDPTETHNLAPSEADLLATWRGRLVDELRDRPEGYVANNDLVAGRQILSTLPWAGVGRAAAAAAENTG